MGDSSRVAPGARASHGCLDRPARWPDPPDTDHRPGWGACSSAWSDLANGQDDERWTGVFGSTNPHHGFVRSYHNFFDVVNYGFVAGNSVAKHLGVILEDNSFDLDYYRVNANSNLNGTYNASGTPTAIELGDYEGVIIRRNKFRNCCKTVSATNAALQIIEDNTVYCGTPTAVGFNVANVGVGVIPSGYGLYDYVICDCDPTSATYGDVTFIPVKSKSSIPASGWYPKGWIV